MGSQVLNKGIFVVESVPDTFSETKSSLPVEWGAHPALSARAVIAVSGLGAGFWYVLWKIALHFVAGR